MVRRRRKEERSILTLHAIRRPLACLAVLAPILLGGCLGTLASRNEYRLAPYRGVPTPEPGKAVVCVYRIWRFASGGATLRVFKDSQVVGVSHRGSYFCNQTDPGASSYYVEWGGFFEKVTSSVLVRAEPGQRYYVSFLADRQDMKEVSESLALQEMQGLEYSELTP